MQHVRQLAKRHALPAAVAGVFGIALLIAPEIAFAGPVDAIAGMLAQIILWIASFIGSVALYLLEIFFTKVISYNDFIHHGIVEKGWTMVRDVVNIGFIAVLLVIAIGTMFGISRMNWRQQVPMLLLGAVIVNFSRLICGLLIDVGQVFMITFANAIQQAGAGNFLQLFSIDKIQSLSNSAPVSGSILFVVSLFALSLSVIILIVVFVFMAILVYRIVVLWVLIILSPIAFLIGAAKGVFNTVGSEYSQWWQKLVASITIGPILLFFLWLALTAVAGGGLSLPGGSTELSPSGSALAASGFDIETLTSFVIAIALLLAGLEVAQQTAGQIGGFAGKAAAMGKGYATKVAGAPIAAGALVGGYALRKGIQKTKSGVKSVTGGARDLYRGTTAESRQRKMEAERRRAQRLASDTGRFGAIRRAQGRSRLAKLGEREKLEKTRQAELVAKHKGEFDTYSPEEKKAFIASVKGKKVVSETEKAKVAAIENGTVLDSKQFEEMMAKDRETAKKWYTSVKDRAKDQGDEDTLKRLGTMAETRPSLAAKGRDGMAAAYSGMDRRQLQRINTDEFKDPEALAAAMDAGLFDQVNSDPKGYSKSMQDMAKRFAGSPAGAANATRAKGEQTRFEGERERIAQDAGLTDDQRTEANRRNEATRSVVTASLTDDLKRVLDGGVKLQDVDVAQLNPADIAKLLKTAAPDAMGDLSTRIRGNDAAGSPNANLNGWKTEIRNALLGSRLTTGASAKELQAIDQNRTAVTQSANMGYGYDKDVSPSTPGGVAGGGWSAEGRREFKASVTNSPNMVVHLAAELDADGGNNDLSKSVAETVTKDGLKGLLENLDKSRGGADEAQQRAVLERLGQVAMQWEGRLTGDMAKAVDEAAAFYRKRVAGQLERNTYS